jgi:hypothetical protein
MPPSNLPQASVPFANSDKVGRIEKWTQKRAADLGNFPSPSRILLIGPPGGGKSNLVKNLVIHQRSRYSEVYIVHPDEASTEWDDLEATETMPEIPPLDFWSELPTHDDAGAPIKRAIVLDDIEYTSSNKEQQRNLATLLRYCSTHKFLTVYICHQSFFDLPPLAKKMANVFIVWKPRARNEVALIENRVGLLKGALKALFDSAATGPQDSICIDHTYNSPSRLRLNVWQPIPEEGYAAV